MGEPSSWCPWFNICVASVRTQLLQPLPIHCKTKVSPNVLYLWCYVAYIAMSNTYLREKNSRLPYEGLVLDDIQWCNALTKTEKETTPKIYIFSRLELVFNSLETRIKDTNMESLHLFTGTNNRAALGISIIFFVFLLFFLLHLSFSYSPFSSLF